MKSRLLSGLMVVASLVLFQGCFTGAFYQPDRIQRETPADYHLCYEEILFSSRDGTRLCGWFIPAKGKALGTVVYFHGNYGNQTYYLKQVHWLPAEKFNVFTFDYRGYGRSEGKPSKRGVYEDSVAAMEYILTKPGIDRGNVFVFGQSLGGVNAIAALDKNDFAQIRAVAVEGTFYSYRSEAQDVMVATTREKIGPVPCLPFPIWPVSFFAVTDSYSPADYVHRLSPIPVLLIHCLEDATVSFRHSERLYRAAKDPKELWLIQGCGHLKVFTNPSSAVDYRQRLVQFFMDHRRTGSDQ